ncbi:coatomer subunit gamma [Saitoella coloradoensis]
MSGYKKDEDIEGTPFASIDKTTVFQEARIFNSSPISPRKCRTLLTKIAYLLSTSTSSAPVFTKEEATQLFFGVSKLFQNKDAGLRQMVYVVIKELASVAEDVIMVTSSIMKDTAMGSDVVFRPNAIRALCRVIDSTTVQAIERLIKTAIVDKHASVSSAALVSSFHLLPIASPIIKHWANETQEAVTASKIITMGGQQLSGGSSIAQYHALGLLYQMRSGDRMGVIKMITQFASSGSSSSGGGMMGKLLGGGGNGSLKSSAGLVMLIRYAAKIAAEDPNQRASMVGIIESLLRHRSDMVNIEAAKALLDIPNVQESEAQAAVTCLQLFLTSPRYAARFAAIRTLNKFAMRNPAAVSVCNPDIEGMIADSNRSVATFAITTLLKTGNEASVDRLMKQIQGFMGDISDEFKATIVDAVRSLVLKFPAKQGIMLAFLSGVLRDEGGYDFKRCVVEAVFDMIKFVPESREEALSVLCDFIEDCEYSKLAVRILHLLGQQGPGMPMPRKYIRYIYNRVALENALVRAAAVSALARFAVGDVDQGVKTSVKVLLARCMDDIDDEVRDRAALALRCVEDEEMANKFVKNDAVFSLPVLEQQLVLYVSDTGSFEKPFDIKQVPVITREQADVEAFQKKTQATTIVGSTFGTDKPAAKAASAGASVGEASAPVEDATSRYAQALAAVPEFGTYGAVLKSSREVELTEREMEYVVSAVKHVFKEHVVLQFDVQNTIPDTLLENVSMVAVPEDEESLEEEFIIPLPTLTEGAPGTIYVAFRRVEPEMYPITSFTNTLKFTTKEVDPTTGEPEESGFDDEYQVENLELVSGDFISPTFIGSFTQAWDTLGPANQATETYALSSLPSLAEATKNVIGVLGMQPLEGTDSPTSTTTHMVKLSGRATGGEKVLASVQMVYASQRGVTVKITARAESEGAAALVVNGIA